MSEPTIETISSDERAERVRIPRRPRGIGVGTQATALGGALSLVMVGGLVTAAYRSFHGTPDPTSLIPASAFAVAVADLSTPGDALDAFADHFPGSPTRRGDGSAVERLLRAAFKSDGDVDYDREIGSWLGDRVAIAGWLDGDDHPQIEALLESTDDDAARKHMSKFLSEDGSDDGAFVISDGYVVVADSTELAHAALRRAHASSVATSGSYADDVARLPEGEAAVGWMDGPAVRNAIEQALGDGADMVLSQADPFGLNGQFLRGRLAAGLRIADDYVQLDLATVGAPEQKTAASSRVTDLPNGTVAAFEIGDPAAPIQAASKVLRELTQDFGTAPPPMVYPTPTSADCSTHVGVYPPDSAIPLGTPDRRRLLRQLHRAERQAERASRPPADDCIEPPSYQPPSPPDPGEAIREATGLSFPDDVTTLLGTGTVVSYGGLQLGGLPDLAIRTTPRDLPRAQMLAETLRQHVQDKAGVDIAVKTAADDLVLATSADYADQVTADGALGEQKLPQLALGDVPDQVSALGYVDLSRLWPLAGDGVPAGITHLKALGFWSAVDGSVQRMQLRVVAG